MQPQGLVFMVLGLFSRKEPPGTAAHRPYPKTTKAPFPKETALSMIWKISFAKTLSQIIGMDASGFSEVR